MSLWNIITIVSVVFMTLLIMVQTRGAGLGAGLGGAGSSEMNTTRRGADKSIFQLTIISATVFVLSILLELILA